jgi:hypothetical protein
MPVDWTALLVSWLPFLFLILVWALLAQGLGRARKRMNEFYETELRRTNALLDRIAVALEKRDR